MLQHQFVQWCSTSDHQLNPPRYPFYPLSLFTALKYKCVFNYKSVWLHYSRHYRRNPCMHLYYTCLDILIRLIISIWYNNELTFSITMIISCIPEYKICIIRFDFLHCFVHETIIRSSKKNIHTRIYAVLEYAPMRSYEKVKSTKPILTHSWPISFSPMLRSRISLKMRISNYDWLFEVKKHAKVYKFSNFARYEKSRKLASWSSVGEYFILLQQWPLKTKT